MRIEFDMVDFEKKFNKALWGIAIDTQESLKSKLNQEHGKDTGSLQSSIVTNVHNDIITINMAEHGKYLEFGTAPHHPPVDELKGWAKKKTW